MDEEVDAVPERIGLNSGTARGWRFLFFVCFCLLTYCTLWLGISSMCCLFLDLKL